MESAGRRHRLEEVRHWPPPALPLLMIGGWVVVGIVYICGLVAVGAITSGCSGCPYSLLLAPFFIFFWGALSLPGFLGSVVGVLVLLPVRRWFRWLQLLIALLGPPVWSIWVISNIDL